jgi:hypothetical protein
VVAAGGCGHALGEVGAGAQRLRADETLDLTQLREDGASLIDLATRDSGPNEQLEGGEAIQQSVLGRLA